MAAALAVGAAVPLHAPVADAAPVTAGEQLGISAGSSVLSESDADRQRELDAIAASGVQWFAVDIDWNSTQPTRSRFTWDTIDRVVREAHARGLSILGTIAYAPAWARGPDCPSGTTHCLPADPEDFAAFAQAAAQRYGTGSTVAGLRGTVSAWQIWNEPNHYPFVQPVVDVAAYTAMLKASYLRIKSVDPAATVLAGGTAPAPDDPSGRDLSPMSFLMGIYANGGRGFFDAFAHHPYSFPCDPLTAKPWNAYYQTLMLHVVMSANGDGAKRIWGTEAGAPTGSDLGTCSAGSTGVSVTETTQAVYLVEEAWNWTVTWDSFTGPLIFFQIRDSGTDPMNWDDHLGLLGRDFSTKLSYRRIRHWLTGT
jgi:hypothetical protein